MEHFIDTVRKYPCLWNTAAIEYKDQELKDAAWGEVMKETNLTSVKEVKLKWKKLRDSYRDALKRQSEMLAKDPNNPAKKNYPWKYMSLMQFLQPHMNNRKKTQESSPSYTQPQPTENGNFQNGTCQNGACQNGNCQNVNCQNGDQSDSESESEAESSSKRKHNDQLNSIDKKLEYLCKTQNKKMFTDVNYQERKREMPSVPDPLDIFFNSMCQSTKRLPYPTQIKIKRILFNAVVEAEETLVAEQQSYASLWAQGAMSSSSSEAGDEDEPREQKPVV